MTEAFPPSARSARSQHGRRIVRSATAVASSGLLVGMGAAAAAPALAAEATDCLPGNTVTSTNNPADIVTIQGLLDANTAIVCLSGTFVLASPLTFDHDVTIFGLDAARLDGNSTSQILLGSGSGALTVQNLALDNGRAVDGGAIRTQGSLTIDNSTFTGNQSLEDGGAVYARDNLGDPTVSITDSTFTGNSTGPAIDAFDGYSGGAVYVEGSRALTITDSTFSDNEASELGGAVVAYAVLASGSTFDENTAPEGGAVAGFVAVTEESTFLANTASNLGGAVRVFAYAASFASTFLDNVADSAGGAIASGATGDDVGYGAVIVLNSTFVDNAAGEVGGAILAAYGQVGLSTFLDNQADTADPAEHSDAIFLAAVEEQLELAGNIFAGSRDNAQLGASDPVYVDRGGNVFSTSQSAEGALGTPDASTLFNRSVASIFGPSPQLGANGGTTDTLALINTSPAIDVVPPGALLDFGFVSAPALDSVGAVFESANDLTVAFVGPDLDQRSVERSGLLDAGAYEFGDAELAATGPDESTTTLLAGFAALLLGIGASFAIGTRRLPRHTR